MFSFGNKKGFTLIELITVIMILGVVSLGISGFIGRGAEIYVDVTEREQIISDSRFVIERLNRELRAALPNSLRLSVYSLLGETRRCIEFTPVKWSSFYLDIPVIPEGTVDTFDAVQLIGDTDSYDTDQANADFVVVYPTHVNHIYKPSDLRRFGLKQVDNSAVTNIVTLTMDAPIAFPADSPASRLYIVGAPVSYCVNNSNQITRHENYGFKEAPTADDSPSGIGPGVLMAEHVVNDLSHDPEATTLNEAPFRISDATLVRNAFVHIRLLFDRDENEEVAEFNNEVQIANAP